MEEVSPVTPYKILLYRNKLEALLRGEFPKPVTLRLGLSNLCNHDCIHCATRDFLKVDHSVLPWNMIEKSLEDPVMSEVKGVILSGSGEPLTSPHLDKVLNYCIEKGLQVSIVTNGSLLHRHIEQFGKCARYVRVSLDAATAETWRKIHRPQIDNYDQILRSLSEIKRPWNTVGCSFLVMEENKEEVIDCGVRLLNEGIDYLQIRPVQECTPETKRVPEGEYNSIVNEVLQFFLNEPLKIFCRPPTPELRDSGLVNCLSGILAPFLIPNGRLSTCCRSTTSLGKGKDYTIGSLHNHTVTELWGSPAHIKLLDDLSKEMNCTGCRMLWYDWLIQKVLVEDEIHGAFI